MGQRAYTLIVRDMRVRMHIGIFEQDKSILHPLSINLEADVLLPDDWQTDSYDQILGYDKMVDMIRALASEGHIHLVETLAETIAERCFGWQQVRAVRVRVEKPEMYEDCIPGVQISRERP